MRRRRFIKISGAALGAGLSGGAVYWLTTGHPPSELTIEAALDLVDGDALMAAKTQGTWDLHQVLSHLAQSVEYSMVGYPEHKSSLFKSTVGAAAFGAFAIRGKMIHGLSDPIPGAPPLEPSGEIAAARARLREALAGFRAFTGRLAPHFAYGELSKPEYERAHVMHLRNHLDELVM
jgi:hypothetical protein